MRSIDRERAVKMSERIVHSQQYIHVPGEIVTVDVVSDEVDARKFIQHRTQFAKYSDPFCVADLGKLLTLYDEWKLALPNVEIFYAVKANDNPVIIKILAALGVGFDCSSMNEIKRVLGVGVQPDKIIFANPCKMVSHLVFAAEENVRMSTFDNETELHKVKKYLPTSKLVIRLRADDEAASYILGLKFGCTLPVAKELLTLAKSLKLDVIGVCFHVGSGCHNPSAYKSALEACAEVFNFGASLGYDFTLLDIGGGFPGVNMKLFKDEAAVIRESLEQYFSEEKYPSLRIAAEPGRFFPTMVESVATNITNVKTDADENGPLRIYHINDGTYGSFMTALFDEFNRPVPLPLKLPCNKSPSIKSVFWGPTLDTWDKINESSFPEMNAGDWIYFENMGAYSRACSTNFNGFTLPVCHYFIRESQSSLLIDLGCSSHEDKKG